MLVDRLANPMLATHLQGGLREAVEYLRSTDMASVALGRHDLDGDRVFALVQEYTTRTADRCLWEAHRRYIDVQYVILGVERMGYASIAHVVEREPYDPARDVAFFEPGEDFITVHAGMLAIFGPEDVHAPCGAAGEMQLVRKVVMKVAVSSAHSFGVAAATQVSTSASDGPPRAR